MACKSSVTTLSRCISPDRRNLGIYPGQAFVHRQKPQLRISTDAATFRPRNLAVKFCQVLQLYIGFKCQGLLKGGPNLLTSEIYVIPDVSSDGPVDSENLKTANPVVSQSNSTSHKRAT
ncbi:hypothetical protein RRG08_030514 [Elysia crispata]|uniref:Uncharacterized protein n=1 Tax=Elysia crispata TaxID=231223 RepID=A0AAE1E267_9GAST|nr:hypothetical protein RRG08_030514 [Elysia crispata]